MHAAGGTPPLARGNMRCAAGQAVSDGLSAPEAYARARWETTIAARGVCTARDKQAEVLESSRMTLSATGVGTPRPYDVGHDLEHAVLVSVFLSREM